MTEPTPPKRRRRWFSVSLRGLMVLVLVAGGVLGWKARRAAIQRKAVEAIKAAGGGVEYDWVTKARNASPVWINNPPHWAPDWLRKPIGDEYFQDVSAVYLQSLNPKAEVPHDPATYEAVATLDRCEELYLLRYPVDDADFARLMAMPRLKGVALLDVNVTEAGLECLESSPAIEVLTLRSKRGAITGRGLAAIARQPRIKNLTLIFIDINDPAELAPLAKLTRLEHLALYKSPDDDACLKHLEGLDSLKTLDFRQTPLTDAGVEWLAKLDGLEEMRFDGSKLTEIGLARLAALPSLKEMNLEPLPRLTDRGLASLDKLQTSASQSLTATDVTDAGLSHLKRLKLQRLTASGLGVTDAGLQDLVENNQVLELDLSGTGITGAGLKSLEDLPTLRWLSLDGTKVDDAGVANLVNLAELTSLSLDGTAITDGSLGALQRLGKLEALQVRGTKVTPGGLEAFRKARPGVVVKSGPIGAVPAEK